VTASTAPAPAPSAVPPGSMDRPPRWVSIALILSGIVLIVLETPNLLFFVGLLFAVIGLYFLLEKPPVPQT
jgi:membrane-bound ClpP family serine protease